MTVNLRLLLLKLATVWLLTGFLFAQENKICEGNLRELAKKLHSTPIPNKRLQSDPYARWGKYDGLPIEAKWLIDGRLMELTSELKYTDPCGTVWDAPIGSKTDGASIPQFAWSIIGGPYEGYYRIAAVIHDVACDRKERPWPAVHEAFYYAMLAGGGFVQPWHAKILFAAVYYFGPRWPTPHEKISQPAALSREQFDVLAWTIKHREAKSRVAKSVAPSVQAMSLTEIENWH